MILDRDTILSRRKLKREAVSVEEWEGDVIVRELSGEERAQVEARFMDTGDQQVKAANMKDFRAQLIVLAAINEDGSRMFQDSDIEAVNQLSGAAIDQLATVIMRLSGYSKTEQERIKKNSQAGDVSTIGSPLH